jgi:hypothetical protein
LFRTVKAFGVTVAVPPPSVGAEIVGKDETAATNGKELQMFSAILVKA